MRDVIKTLNGENTEVLCSFEYGVYVSELERLVIQTPDRKSAEALCQAIERAQHGVLPAAKFRPVLVSRKVTTKRDLWMEV